jgi:hypothetical protein
VGLALAVAFWQMTRLGPAPHYAVILVPAVAVLAARGTSCASAWPAGSTRVRRCWRR